MTLTRHPLSATIITHNAGATLPRCLESLADLADEIVVVDSGSTDDTRVVAERFGVRWFDQPWLGYGRQKQYAVDAATHDWILSLDSDEALSLNLVHSITTVLIRPTHPVYALARQNYFMGRALCHGEGYPDWVVRLFDRRKARWSHDTIHEKVMASVTPQRLEGVLRHDSAVNIRDYLERQNRYSTLAAEAMWAEGKRSHWLRAIASPLLRFMRFYILKSGWRDGFPGFCHITIGLFTSFVKHMKLIERARRTDRSETP